MDKAAARKLMKAVLAGIPVADLESRSALAAARLLASQWWREADVVLAFLAMPGEPDPRAVVSAAHAEGKTAAAPLIVDGALSFRVIAGDTKRLARDTWGIPQPDPSWPAWVPGPGPANVLVVTPGLAFDAKMHRLGRGRGYYDRFLARLRAVPGIRCTAVAFCLDEQVVDHLPHDARDQGVDAIVTDRRTIG
ncbi:MAG: 5-formyltetrahydrofolate cyclo-ligase [Spirochaetes bacterium]|nr:5-formyltetrahydrofolate cyclo-ligase [Spirochaetota bacterium]